MKWDVIVIGAGHNGLIAACYLAKAGKRVLVLERREIVGGACVTEEVWPGYHVSTGAYLCSLLMPEIVQDLDLVRHGFHVYRRETSGFAPFPDGTALYLYPDADPTRQALLAFCADTPQDVDAFFQFEADVERAADILDPLLTATSTPSSETVRAIFEAHDALALYDDFITGSVRQLLDRRFASAKLKAVLATDGLIGTYGGPSTPGTAYVLLHHYLGRILGGRGSWGYVRGGMGRITQALATTLLEAGGTIRTNAPVARIDTVPDESDTLPTRRVTGVQLANGEHIEADTILSNADPYHTFEVLLADPTSPTTHAPWHALKTKGGASAKINLAVTALPTFTASHHPTLSSPDHLGTIHLCPDIDYLERAWEEAQNGYPSTEPMIEIYMQTATDPTLAPAGSHMVSMFVQYFPYNLAPGLDLDTERERFTQRVFAIVERYAPGFTASILHRQTLTPRELEARFGLTGGHIFHGDLLPPNLWNERSHPADSANQPANQSANQSANLPKGLHLCGSGTHPGGCVYGAPGYNAGVRRY